MLSWWHLDFYRARAGVYPYLRPAVRDLWGRVMYRIARTRLEAPRRITTRTRTFKRMRQKKKGVGEGLKTNPPRKTFLGFNSPAPTLHVS